MTVWGNHSATQYPDIFHATIVGPVRRPRSSTTSAWLDGRLHPDRAASAARRSSRRAARRARPRPRTPRSTTCTTGCSARRTATGSRWRVPSDGSYGVPEGLICGFPVHLLAGAVLDRPGPRPRRVLPRAHRRERGRAGGRAQSGRRPRPDLTEAIPRPGRAWPGGLVSERVPRPVAPVPSPASGGEV